MAGVLEVIDRANQRGGRMLSVVDLIEAGTMTQEAAAWTALRILEGASFLVGAQPGGAGKTTVMGALLGLLPPGEPVRLARTGTGWESAGPGECIVAYEIGAGSYEAYIWGNDLIEFCSRGAGGARIVTNLHADTPEQAEKQIVDQNGVSPENFLAFDLFLPIRMHGRWPDIRRRIPAVYEAVRTENGGRWCQVRFDGAGSRDIRAVTGFFTELSRRNIRHMADVRHEWISWIESRT